MTIDQAPAWVRRLGDKQRRAGVLGLQSAAARLVSIIVGEIIPREPRVPVDRGIYRAGWRVRPLPDGAVVYNSTPHATFIEDGVRGDNVKIGKALIDALTKWVQRKGLTGAAKSAEAGTEARRIAWAIAKSMQKKGIFNGGGGLKIMARARTRIPGLIDEEVRREMRRSGEP